MVVTVHKAVVFYCHVVVTLRELVVIIGNNYSGLPLVIIFIHFCVMVTVGDVVVIHGYFVVTLSDILSLKCVLFAYHYRQRGRH